MGNFTMPRLDARPRNRPPSLTVVGRSVELSALTAALNDADAGRGRTVFVVGESGIGKTHLVSAFAEQAAQRGFTVATGRAYPVETGVPYAVFADALLPVLRSLEPPVLALLTRGGTAELMQLFPALDGDRRDASSARGDPAPTRASVSS